MLVMSAVIPLAMVGFGNYFIKSAGPAEINMLFGYRTSMSMKNKETWAFAHVVCGRIWRVVGWVMLVNSVGATLLMIGQDIHDVGIFGTALMGLQCVFLILPIIPTEIALRKQFDKNGNRKDLS